MDVDARLYPQTSLSIIKLVADGISATFKSYRVVHDDHVAVVALASTGAIVGIVSYEADGDLRLKLPFYSSRTINPEAIASLGLVISTLLRDEAYAARHVC